MHGLFFYTGNEPLPGGGIMISNGFCAAWTDMGNGD